MMKMLIHNCGKFQVAVFLEKAATFNIMMEAKVGRTQNRRDGCGISLNMILTK